MLTSLLGYVELHADNSIALGKGLFQLVAKRTVPRQAVPTTHLLCESFKYANGEVRPDTVEVKTSRQYFWRPRVCYGAWLKQKAKDLNCFVGNHPLEDVIHIHAWIQLHQMHIGSPPTQFYWLPGMVPRHAELVPGRIYPILKGDDTTGTVCVCPEGQSHTLLCPDGMTAEALDLEVWHAELRLNEYQVAPLIFRRHAAVYVNGEICVLLLQNPERPSPINGIEDKHIHTIIADVHPDNYLDFNGNYMVSAGSHGTHMPWKDVHAGLLAIGTHLLARKADVESALSTQESRPRLPPGSYTYVKGWLRYPDECDEIADEETVYMAFNVSTQANECQDVCVLAIPVENVNRVQDMPGAEFADRLLP